MSKDDTPQASGAHVPEGSAPDALREGATSRSDRIRARFIESLARRTGVHEGDARRVLDDRLARLLAKVGEDPDAARAAESPPASSRRGALAELVEHIARQALPSTAGPEQKATETTPLRGDPIDPEALRYFRRTWSRLSADQRLSQSLSTLPENAGPLNSHHLVHQSLTLLRDLSPGYFDQLGTYLDALLWIELANESAEAAPVARAAGNRKGARGRQA